MKHSHSSLDSFATCPHRYYRERIARDVRPEQGIAASWGDEVHKALEAYVLEGTPLPSNMAQYQETADRVRALPGDIYVEANLAITKTWIPVEYTSPDAWFRAKIDVLEVRGTLATIVDYKTGKSQYGTKKQDARYAAVVMANFPSVSTVRCRWIYLAEDKTTRETFERTHYDNLKRTIDDSAADVQFAVENERWPCKPSGLCRGFCPVSDCAHWKPPRDRT
jgi:RecB family exonuclease